MLQVWESSKYRPTLDIDMLAITSNRIDSIIEQVRDIIDVSVESDGIEFNVLSIAAERIKGMLTMKELESFLRVHLMVPKYLCRLISVLGIKYTPNQPNLICQLY